MCSEHVFESVTVMAVRGGTGTIFLDGAGQKSYVENSLKMAPKALGPVESV